MSKLVGLTLTTERGVKSFLVDNERDVVREGLRVQQELDTSVIFMLDAVMELDGEKVNLSTFHVRKDDTNGYVVMSFPSQSEPYLFAKDNLEDVFKPILFGLFVIINED